MRTKVWLGLSVLPCVLGILAGCHRDRAAATTGPTALGAPSETRAVTEADKSAIVTAPTASAPGPAKESAGTPDAPPVAAAAARAAGAAGPAPRSPAKPSMRARPVEGDPFGAKDLSALSGLGLGAAPAPTTAPMGAFGVSPQFAGVKAGEWDDNANYREFQKFLASSPAAYHRVDLRDRRFLVVRDGKGHGMPRCKVTVGDQGQRARPSFVTTASGRAILFPHAEGLGEGKLTATAECAEGTAQATFAVGANESQDGVVDLVVQGERRAIGARAVDLAFVLDTTGSMSEEITAVKATIQKVAKSLSSDQVEVRIGLVEYKDRGDPFVTKVYPFSKDLVGFAQRVAQINASGGGDTPEDMNAGLHSALTELAWSQDSVARLAFVIGDAPPHLDYRDGPDYAADMKSASHRGIQLFTVAASGMDDLGQVVFRQMAQFTGGTEMFVLRGGAGPESVGGGDPKSSCGGTHTNYSSGKLDELIVHKIRHELRALEADPMRVAGLGRDENAKPCNERVVFVD